jgi:uncharacterized phage protein (TIGR01671 family)
MREIKYQGFNGTKLQDVRRIDFDADGHTVFWFPCENYPNIFYQNCEKYPLRQFTGFKDKNDKEIYEGDIVEWLDFNNWRVAIVEINPDIQFRIIHSPVRPPSIEEGYIFEYGRFSYSDTEHHLTIIGNIYENPELLK